jgi:hypothetical protein
MKEILPWLRTARQCWRDLSLFGFGAVSAGLLAITVWGAITPLSWPRVELPSALEHLSMIAMPVFIGIAMRYVTKHRASRAFAGRLW